MKHLAITAIKTTFPLKPLPAALFREDVDTLTGDIPRQFSKHFLGKQWNEVLLDDWIGVASISALVVYVTPESFRYYAPSIIIASLENLDYLDWGIEAVLPHNQKLEPRGAWWQSFFQGFTPPQRDAVRMFLTVALSLAAEDDACKFNSQHGLEKIWTMP